MVFVMPAYDKHAAHVRSAEQRCDKKWSSAAFVCGQTWLCIKKGYLVEALSTPALQVEGSFPMAHNEVKVKTTSLCFLCCYVKMGALRSQREKMNDKLVHLFTRQPFNRCKLFSRVFNIMSTLFATNRSPCRKKSILAKVCFGAKRGWLYMRAKWIFI